MFRVYHRHAANKQSFMRDSKKSFGKIDVQDCSLKTQLNIDFESPIILRAKEICACRTPFKETVLLRRYKTICMKMVNDFCY